MNLPLAIIAFIGGLVLLERGADLFTEKVGEVAKRSGVSETVIALLTAGMEWEELAVVLVAAITGSVGIAIGDIVGSNIANLTSSFALGLLVKPVEIRRDDRIYVWGMVGVALLAAGFMLRGQIGRGAGGFLVFVFICYITALLTTLRRGFLRIRFEREGEDDAAEGRESPSSSYWLWLVWA